jgi:branched-chain amino acid transport system substrate-binding protein
MIRSTRLLKAFAALFLLVATCTAQATAPIQIALVEGLSGPFANTGEAVFRNLNWAVERINERGGVRLSDGPAKLVLKRYDSKGQVEDALSALHAAIDDGARYIVQGNSSAVAAALISAIEKHNERDPARAVLFLNYAAVEPSLTNENCSFWHFRFDAHADMRMAALMDVLRSDASVKAVYLIGQDYSFGRAVLKQARKELERLRPDARIVGEDLHPIGRIKDFSPYASKIIASGADTIITGNWGNDLTLLVKAAKDAGFKGRFYTFYGNALGVPAALGEAGVGKVLAVADWLPNKPGRASEEFYRSFRARYPKAEDDYVHLRVFLMMDALAAAIAQARTDDATEVAFQLEHESVEVAGQRGWMRAADHQFQQPLEVGVMERAGTRGVPFDVEGSGYGFRVVRDVSAIEAQQPYACSMTRPEHSVSMFSKESR